MRRRRLPSVSSHLITGGFGKALRMTTLGTFFISLLLFAGKSVFQTCICVADSESEKPSNKQYGNLQLHHFTFFHSFSHRGAVMTDCVMVIKLGCGW